MAKAKRDQCPNCGASLGAYEVRCSFCEAALPSELARNRIARVLRAFADLLDAAPLPALADFLLAGAGVSLLFAAWLRYRGFPLEAIVGAAGGMAAVVLSVTFLLGRRVVAARRREFFSTAIAPQLLAFQRERAVSPELLVDAAEHELRESSMKPLCLELFAPRPSD